ncbi:unnamed protein product [Adineta ricciae]|uniref:MULE transposase domain-containing protein n=2 Tax=Adineta ricciae TaxID=249248 RepID=A0A815X554_ADIRI|nr:unnamed protein product [Adineta ricciae]
MIPCIYCLTTKKDEEVYIKILHHIQAIGEKQGIYFNPLRLTCDFEISTMNAFTKVFPMIHIANCFFHYSQSLWRKVQELGLTRYVKYSTSSKDKTPTEDKKKANQWFLSAIGLALIPPNIIENTWTMAMDESTPDHHSSIKFNDYLVSTYVDSSSSRFHFNTWNVNDAIVNNMPRMNNHVEGYNNILGTLFPIHPHTYRFIELLRDEHLFQQHQAEQSKCFVPRGHKSSDDITAELLSLLKKYKKGELDGLQLSIQCGKAVKTKLVIK